MGSNLSWRAMTQCFGCLLSNNVTVLLGLALNLLLLYSPFLLQLGYYTPVTGMAEVQEQVLKYLPVMARPLVMYRNYHPVQWTGVYADIEVNLILLRHFGFLREDDKLFPV